MAGEMLSKLAELARTLPADRFVARFPWDFLRLLASDQVTIDYVTRTVGTAPSEALERGDVIPLVKSTASTPGVHTLVVGRSRACDVTLGFASVSKVHARIHLERGHVKAIEDARSHNGTFVRGQRIEPLAQVPVKVGEAVTFGSVDAVLLDAARLHAWLNGGR